MLHTPFLRRKLAHHLRSCAAHRRQLCGSAPSGDDLKVIALLDRLSDDAEHVSQDIVDSLAQRCGDPAFSQRFETTWDGLGDIIGTLLVPRDATALVAWMVKQAEYGSDATITGPVSTVPPAERVAKSREPSLRTVTTGSVVGDFTGALAVVGPALAIWEGAAAVAQWRDHAYVRTHPQTVATVVGGTEYDGGRSASRHATEILSFTPAPGQAACTVSVALGGRSPNPVGETLMVVPRSLGCEPPLLVAAIGDPITSMTMAVAFLASGIASLQFWLRKRPQPTAYGRARRSPAMRMPISPERTRDRSERAGRSRLARTRFVPH